MYVLSKSFTVRKDGHQRQSRFDGIPYTECLESPSSGILQARLAFMAANLIATVLRFDGQAPEIFTFEKVQNQRTRLEEIKGFCQRKGHRIPAKAL